MWNKPAEAAGDSVQCEENNVVLAAFDTFSANLQHLVTKDDLQLAVKDLEKKINLVRTELGHVRAYLEKKFDVQSAKFNGEMTLLKSMMGVLITLSIAIGVRLFFFGPH